MSDDLCEFIRFRPWPAFTNDAGMDPSMIGLPGRFYYRCRPLIPRSLQLFLRRLLIAHKVNSCRSIWPIDERAAGPPEGWTGWPEGKEFAFILSHDVDTARGHGRCMVLAELDQRMGFRSSFNFVPERYKVSPELRKVLVERGFEVAVHGLVHDGRLFVSRRIFQKRAVRINRYIREWGAVGFHSPSMQRNLKWILNLDIEYDQSTFDTDPFEPQPEGVKTLFPFLVRSGTREYVEIPYTLPQDHCLFVLLREESNTIWKRKLDWIARAGGMAFLTTHPDYMDFSGSRSRKEEEYPVDLYSGFLEYLRSEYADRYWHVAPKELGRYWRRTMSEKGDAVVMNGQAHVHNPEASGIDRQQQE